MSPESRTRGRVSLVSRFVEGELGLSDPDRVIEDATRRPVPHSLRVPLSRLAPARVRSLPPSTQPDLSLTACKSGAHRWSANATPRYIS